MVNNAEESRSKPRFRIQEAILILRQGKSHPHWREAAWHLMEYAGKDTLLLLEAQRDLIENADKDEAKPWLKYLLMAVAGFIFMGLLFAIVWKVIEHLKLVC